MLNYLSVFAYVSLSRLPWVLWLSCSSLVLVPVYLVPCLVSSSSIQLLSGGSKHTESGIIGEPEIKDTHMAKGISDDLIKMLSEADKQRGLPPGTMFSVMQQETGGKSQYVDDPTT